MTEKKRTIVILGSRHVGKTAIIQRFVNNTFNKNHFPTVQNTFSKNIKLGTTTYGLKIIDTAGIGKYELFDNPMYSIGVDGYVFVFSVDEEESLNNLKIINEKVESATFGCAIPKLFVANKIDLRKREVSKKKLNQFREEVNGNVVQVSAKTGENIQFLFESLLDLMPKPQTTQKPLCNIL